MAISPWGSRPNRTRKGLRIKSGGYKTVVRKGEITDRVVGKILEDISKGLTVTQACVRADIDRTDFLSLVESTSDLKDRYAKAIKLQASALVDDVLTEGMAKGITESDARIAAMKQKLVAWYSSRIDPVSWQEKKSYEFGGQITMQHTHQLTVEQRERIATAWLMSRDSKIPMEQSIVTIRAEPVEVLMRDGERKRLEYEPDVADHPGDVIIEGVPATQDVKKK